MKSGSLSPPFARANLHLVLVFNTLLPTKRLWVRVCCFLLWRKRKRVKQREGEKKMRKTTVVSGASRENNTTISVILRKQREMSQTTTALYLVWTHTHTQFVVCYRKPSSFSFMRLNKYTCTWTFVQARCDELLIALSSSTLFLLESKLNKSTKLTVIYYFF